MAVAAAATTAAPSSAPAAVPAKKRPKKQKTFVIQGAKITALRTALELRGWSEEDDVASTSFGLKWTIKADKAEQHIVDGTVRDDQILNHYQRAWEMITKHRFSGNLRALPWTDGIDPDAFVPRSYYIQEAPQLKEFVADYFVTAARATLQHALALPAWPPVATDRVTSAVAILDRFLARMDEAAVQSSEAAMDAPSSAKGKRPAAATSTAGEKPLLAAAVESAFARAVQSDGAKGGGGGGGADDGSGWLHRCAALRGADPLVEIADWRHFVTTVDAACERRLKRALGVGAATPAAAAISAALMPSDGSGGGASGSSSAVGASSRCSGSGAAAALALREPRGGADARASPGPPATACKPARADAEQLLRRFQLAFPPSARPHAEADAGGTASAAATDEGASAAAVSAGTDGAADDMGAAADDMQTAWILKSVNKSRGRGITIECDLPSILSTFEANEYRLVAQRYIERPLLILRRKFDIRQWVLVTSINPLVVWRYSNYYLRFSSKEYSSSLGGDDYRIAHLTNQSIQKKCDDYGGAIDGNMWSRSQFHGFLAEQHGAEAGAATAALIEQRMKSVIGSALRSVCDVIEPRAASFELYGFDFMIDERHGVWLLEANSSPDMSRNAAPLRQIVDDGLDDLLNVVVDLQHKRVSASKLAAEREGMPEPCWRLAFRGKAIDERDLMKRRFRKKCGADALAVAKAAAEGAKPGADDKEKAAAAGSVWK